MAELLKPITGKDGYAHFFMGSSAAYGAPNPDYRCVLDGFSFREVVEMSVDDTFCTEGVADQEPGRSQLQGSLSGIGAKGTSISGPLIPAPQGVYIHAVFSGVFSVTETEQCWIDLIANFTEASADRMVNQTMRISGRFLSKGEYTKTWKITWP